MLLVRCCRTEVRKTGCPCIRAVATEPPETGPARRSGREDIAVVVGLDVDGQPVVLHVVTVIRE